MSQITFPVILLFAFSKRERRVALRTRYLEVWHRSFSTRMEARTPTLICSLERWRCASFIHEVMVRKPYFKHNAEKLRVPTVNCRECTPANSRIQFFCVAHTRQEISDVWRARNTALSNYVIYSLLPRHVGCSLKNLSMDHPDVRRPTFD
jgi:hypothetical protein